MKKINLMISLLVLALLMLAGCGTGQALRQSGVAATTTTGLAATSCDGDEKCEARNLRVDGHTDVNTLGASSVVTRDATVSQGVNITGGGLNVAEPFPGTGPFPGTRLLSVVNSPNNVLRDAIVAISPHRFVPNEGFYSQVLVNANLAVIGKINSTSLGYRSTINPSTTVSPAFVCVDQGGVLFRSDVPCR